MKTQQMELLLGGLRAPRLSADASIGLNSLTRRLAEKSEEDLLFEIALRRVNDEDLRKLVRFRLDSENSKFLD